MRWFDVSRCGKAVILASSTKISQSFASAKFHKPITVASCETPALPTASTKRSRLLCGLVKTMARFRLWKVSSRPGSRTPPPLVATRSGLPAW